MSTVVVTGGSGFLAPYYTRALLNAGHTVRATLRNSHREPALRTIVGQTGANLERLSFVIADLERDAGWDVAMAGADYVLHVASPFPAGAVRDETTLLRPAVDGTLRVLRAARDARATRCAHFFVRSNWVWSRAVLCAIQQTRLV